MTYTECFYASIQMTTFFFLSPVNVANYINWFCNLNVLCTPRINSTWSRYILAVTLWNWLANISFRIFSYILMSEINLQVSLFIMSLLIWVSRLYYLIKLIRGSYLLFKIKAYLYLEVWVEFSSKTSFHLGISFVRRFLTMKSIFNFLKLLIFRYTSESFKFRIKTLLNIFCFSKML